METKPRQRTDRTTNSYISLKYLICVILPVWACLIKHQPIAIPGGVLWLPGIRNDSSVHYFVCLLCWRNNFNFVACTFIFYLKMDDIGSFNVRYVAPTTIFTPAHYMCTHALNSTVLLQQLANLSQYRAPGRQHDMKQLEKFRGSLKTVTLL